MIHVHRSFVVNTVAADRLLTLRNTITKPRLGERSDITQGQRFVPPIRCWRRYTGKDLRSQYGRTKV